MLSATPEETQRIQARLKRRVFVFVGIEVI